MEMLLEHWHEKPLVIDIVNSAPVILESSPAAETVSREGKLQMQKERRSPVFSPEVDIAEGGTAPRVRFNDSPVVLNFPPMQCESSRETARRRDPSRAVQWMAAVKVQRAYRRRARHVATSGGRDRDKRPVDREVDGRFTLHTGAALSRQREARRVAALRVVARQSIQLDHSRAAADSSPAAAHLRSPDALVRSSSCSMAPLKGCSSRTLVEAHFDSGPLGLRIAEYARPGREGDVLQVEEIQPGSAAAAVPDLRVGMTLLQINGADVRYAGHTCRAEATDGNSPRWRIGKRSSSRNAETAETAETSWFATVMERMAQRPLTLIFVTDQSSSRSTQSMPSPSSRQTVAHRSGSQLSPVSAVGASPPPPSPLPTRKKSPDKITSGCCAARPPHSRS